MGQTPQRHPSIPRNEGHVNAGGPEVKRSGSGYTRTRAREYQNPSP